jgi:hypothetical protein
MKLILKYCLIGLMKFRPDAVKTSINLFPLLFHRVTFRPKCLYQRDEWVLFCPLPPVLFHMLCHSLLPHPRTLTHLILSPTSPFNFIVMKPFICTADPKSCRTSALLTSPQIETNKFNVCCCYHQSSVTRACVEVWSSLHC